MGSSTVIILDTHIWIWWVHGDDALPATEAALIKSAETSGIGVPAICCWEIAKLVERKRLTLPCSVMDWLSQALRYPGVRLIELSPQISAESAQLPGEFHKDPADQIIVATARILDCPLATLDSRIRDYPHVRIAR